LSSYSEDDKKKCATVQAAADRIAYYVDDLHDIESCGCNPETITYLLNGVSSNADLSLNSNKELHAVKRKLEEYLDSQLTVTIIIPSEDGLTTNLEGFLAFFERFRSLDITVVLLNDTFPNSIK
jgi:uncharacterized protein YqkB